MFVSRGSMGLVMRVSKQIRCCISVAIALGFAALVYRSTKASNRNLEPRVGAQTPHAPPIPAAGPLAGPKSLTQVGVPVEATRAAVPADNPQAPAKIALGEKLFFDGRLSVDETVACSTCHDPALAFTDGRPVSIGVKGRAGQRNAPTILNALYNSAQFWDGRAKTLEDQAALPIMNPSEMGQPSLEAAVAQIEASPEYEQAVARQRVVSRMNRPERDTARAFGPKPVQPKPSRSCAAARPETTPKRRPNISFRPAFGSEQNN
jgi:hypothetical protein